MGFDAAPVHASAAGLGDPGPGQFARWAHEQHGVPRRSEVVRAVTNTDGAVSAARPPVANADYDKNKGWTLNYALQTAVEGIRPRRTDG